MKPIDLNWNQLPPPALLGVTSDFGEVNMKRLLIAAALSAVFVAGAAAQGSDNTRDPAYGKRDMGPSTPSIDKPNSATVTQGMGGGKSGMQRTTKRMRHHHRKLPR